MSAQRILSSKKLLEHGRVLREGKEPRVWGGEKGSMGKGRKKGI